MVSKNNLIPGVSGLQQLTTQTYDTKVNNYIDGLLNEAQGDLNRVLRDLDYAHRTALGTSDIDAAAFLEKVGDALESKIGRIPAQYERLTSREIQDKALFDNRTKQARNLALSRLSEDQKIAVTQEGRQQINERQNTAEDLSSRGLLNAPMGRQTGLGGKVFNEVQTAQQDRMGALERAFGRNTTDINRTTDQALEDRGIQNQRTMEDLKTNARWSSQDQMNSYTTGRADAMSAFDRQKKKLEDDRKQRLYENTYKIAPTGGY